MVIRVEIIHAGAEGAEMKLEFEAEVTLDIYTHNKVAVLKIQDKEFGRICFDKYEQDDSSVVFYVENRDIVNIDVDVITIW